MNPLEIWLTFWTAWFFACCQPPRAAASRTQVIEREDNVIKVKFK
jgi:hypothetical protein